MAGNVLRTRIHMLLVLASILMFCFGVAVLVSGLVLQDKLSDDFPYFGERTCQYWAGIPTMLTGVILALTAFMNRRQSLKYVSLCCLFVTAVPALVMINRESTNLSAIDTIEMDGHWCKTETGVNTDGCKILMKARPWYWVLLLAADLALVLCGFVSLLLFADWMLYVVLKAPGYYQPLENVSINQTIPTNAYLWDQSAMPLQPVS